MHACNQERHNHPGKYHRRAGRGCPAARPAFVLTRRRGYGPPPAPTRKFIGPGANHAEILPLRGAPECLPDKGPRTRGTILREATEEELFRDFEREATEQRAILDDREQDIARRTGAQ